jgi:hypothetical protein
LYIVPYIELGRIIIHTTMDESNLGAPPKLS